MPPHEAIQAMIDVGGLRVQAWTYEQVASTNRLARELASSGRLSGPMVIRASAQTGGYGRFGRPWHSPQGGLWMTLAWPVEGEAARLIDGLGLRVGAACLELLLSLPGSAIAGSRLRLKWPNDVLIDGKKVCGCLCEWVGGAAGQSWLLAGVGINANNDPADLPDSLRRPATSLRESAGATIDLDHLAAALTARLIAAINPERVGQSEARRLIELASAHLWRAGEIVASALPDGRRIEGVLGGLSDDGRVILHTGDGRIVLPHGAELV